MVTGCAHYVGLQFCEGTKSGLADSGLSWVGMFVPNYCTALYRVNGIQSFASDSAISQPHDADEACRPPTIAVLCQVLIQDCYFTSAQAGQIVAAFSYGEDKVEAAVKVRDGRLPCHSNMVKE